MIHHHMSGESPAVQVVPTPWDSPVDQLSDKDLIDVTDWDDKTLRNYTNNTSKGPNDAIKSFAKRNRKHHCIS